MGVMDVSAAFRILELPSGATLADVSGSYRRLLKMYHPDRNLHRTEWSHLKTVELTEAYAAVTDYLREDYAMKEASRDDADHRGGTAPGEPPFGSEENDEWDGDIPGAEGRWTESEPSERNETSDVGYSVSLQLRLATEFDLLLDQLYAYYSCGMEKIHLRMEGSLRYRFRTTLRRVKTVMQSLQELQEWPGSENQHRNVELVHGFAAAFYENMLIKPREHFVPHGDERKAYRLYRQGSDSLDVAIRTRLFDEFRNGDGSPSSRSLAERSLMLLLAQYPRSRYTAETLIKYYLLEAFGRLCAVIDGG
jgi:hypothetical protein